MYAIERHKKIMEMARDHGRVDVAEAASALDVSAETLRRDLTTLERRGLVRRVHGGAVPVERLGFEPALFERERTNLAEKDSIALAAVAQIGDAGSILLDAGSTTVRLAALLPSNRDFTVVTHALPVAQSLAGRPNITLHLVGGIVRGRTLAAVGPWALRELGAIQADVAFLGTNGISVERGMTTPDVTEAAVKRAIVKAARRTVVLADHTKIGRDEFATVAPITDVDTLVTDDRADHDLTSHIESAGVQVIRS